MERMDFNAEIGPGAVMPEKGGHIHFIGIGGSSMSGLALIALDKGYVVSGSDASDSSVLNVLRSKGITVYGRQSADNITSDISLVVYTVAVPETNPELSKARGLNIPVIERGKFLGLISRNYEKCISVTGTHGKTTTTAMLSSIFLTAEKDPTIHLGGTFPLIEGSVRTGGEEYLLTEACEYHAHMLSIDSFAGIILNVEDEHLDFYKTHENLARAFAVFAGNIPENGFLIVCKSDPGAMEAKSAAICPVYTYALSRDDLKAKYEADDIVFTETGSEYTLLIYGEPAARIKLNVPGEHNILNSLAASAAALTSGIDIGSVVEGLARFEGTGRRFENVGNVKGAALIDDYAHHPTEVRVTVDSAKKMIRKGGRLIALFQIHTFTRAKKFKTEFAEALRPADEIIVTDIYPAREIDTGEISGSMINDYFVSRGLNSTFIRSFDEIARHVYSELGENDIVLSLGAGDINKVLGKIKALDAE